MPRQELGRFMYAEQSTGGMWVVLNKRSNAILAYMNWYPTWKRHIFAPSLDELAFSATDTCPEDEPRQDAD